MFDDKRYILDESIHTIAYFHKDFEKVHFNKRKRFLQILTQEKRFKKIPISSHK